MTFNLVMIVESSGEPSGEWKDFAYATNIMKEKIQSFIKEFVKTYKTKNKTATDWDEALIAFAPADNTLFLKLKTHS